jgi:hypothetical protein
MLKQQFNTSSSELLTGFNQIGVLLTDFNQIGELLTDFNQIGVLLKINK